MQQSETSALPNDGDARMRIDERGVAYLSLFRPKQHNALSIELIRDLRARVDTLAADGDVLVVVLTGEGKSFCAGGDLKWMKSMASATRERRIAESGELAALLGALDQLPKPVIARVNGSAYGGGLGLIACCDVSVAASTARFAFTEVTLGLVPANIAPYVVRQIGPGHSRRLMLSGRRFDAGEALAIGLVDRVAVPDDLDSAVEEEVQQFLRCAPGAVAATKRLIAHVADAPPEASAAHAAETLADAWERAEAGEGIAWFLEKRTPSWQKPDA